MDARQTERRIFMFEITSLAEPFHRSHYFSFGDRIQSFPSTQTPHIFVKAPYQGRYFIVDEQTELAYPLQGEMNVFVATGGLLDVDGKMNVGIWGYLHPVETGPEYKWRLEAECDEDGSVEQWIIDTFNGLVEELSLAHEPSMQELDDIFLKWGLDISGRQF